LHSKNKVVLGTTLALAISTAATIYVFRRLPAEAGALFPLPFSVKQIAPAAALLILAWLADSLRLKTLTRALGRNITIPTGLKAILAGNFLTLVTPFLFGGAPAIIYVLKQAGLTWIEAGAVVTVGGWLSQIILVMLSLIALLGLHNLGTSFPWHSAILTGMLLYLAALVGLLILLVQPKLAAQLIALLPPKLQAKAEHSRRLFYHALSTLLSTAPLLLLLSALAATAYFVSLFSIAPAILASKVPQVPVRALLYLQNIAYVGPIFAPTPGASGASELWLLTIFDPVLPRALARQYLLLWRLLTFYLSMLVGGIAFVLSSWQLLNDAVHPRHR